MMQRRDVLMAGACAVGLGAAAKLKPRRSVTLLGDAQLADLVPAQFGDWRSRDAGDPFAINGADSLTSRLYSQLVVRVYTNDRVGQVMLLLAYGAKQTDDLQLHRPEVCYPAFGYNIVENKPYDAVVPNLTAAIPARRLLATQEGRDESVLYWSRIGEFLPRDGGEQREARFKNALQGVIPDGLLARFSATATDPVRPWRVIDMFLPELMASLSPLGIKALVGSERAGRHAKA